MEYKGYKSNFHTHSTFCDGKSTPEEIVKAAIEKGFFAIGFSGHGYTPYDLRYCMKDTDGYVAQISRLKKRYKGQIQIYTGIEEDAFAPIERSRFDYIIGSCHYYCVDGTYMPIDSNYGYFQKCLEAFDYDVVRMAEAYYAPFCEYIKRRKPDIIGHFDLITKFDEVEDHIFLQSAEYARTAEEYLHEAIKSGSLFEVNTGAITRGLRKSVYPYENLLHILKKTDTGIILSSDSHQVDTLDGYFDETVKYLKDIGFSGAYTLCDGNFAKYSF